jgi:hypothetical protein
MPWLIAPEALRVRWTKRIPPESQRAVPDFDRLTMSAAGLVQAAKLESVDFLLLAGDTPTVLGPRLVFSRGGADPKTAKWKSKNGIRVAFNGPVSLFSFAAPADGVPVPVEPGNWTVSWDEGLVRLKRLK